VRVTETYRRDNVLLMSDDVDVKRSAKARMKRSDFIEAFVISRSRGHGSKRRAFLTLSLERATIYD
jgi:hypothetical protein